VNSWQFSLIQGSFHRFRVSTTSGSTRNLLEFEIPSGNGNTGKLLELIAAPGNFCIIGR